MPEPISRTEQGPILTALRHHRRCFPMVAGSRPDWCASDECDWTGTDHTAHVAEVVEQVIRSRGEMAEVAATYCSFETPDGPAVSLGHVKGIILDLVRGRLG